MHDSYYQISLDINAHGSQSVLKAKQFDTARKIHISLRSGGTPYTIADDCYAVFAGTKPDGSILYNNCAIENNEIIYEFTEQTCAVAGRICCEIKLYGLDDALITSPRFVLLVDGTVYPDGRIESTDEFAALTKMVSDGLEVIKGATESTEKANEATEDTKVATQSANAATEAANQATTAATQAAQGANTATENANGATSRANEATQAANNAASAASIAAENANETVANVTHIVKNTMTAGKVAGESVSMGDAVEFGFIGCRIFGKTTQNGTPTPDAPVELVSVGSRGSITVNITGKSDAQSMTIETSNGLPGIPVTSGGNYIDSKGQKWACDEKDYANGVYVQRIGLKTLTGTEDYFDYISGFGVVSANLQHVDHTRLLCSHALDGNGVSWANANAISFKVSLFGCATMAEFVSYVAAQYKNGTPIEIAYVMPTPIETPLSEEELAAYASLHTYRDSTTVSNDAGAYMELEYVMDSKKYIDSKLSSAIHTATVE